MGGAAVQVEQAVLAPGVRRHARHRVEQHMNALEAVEPAEEGEAATPPVALRLSWAAPASGSPGRSPARASALPESPLDVAVGQEARRRYEGVDQPIEGLQEQLASSQPARADLGEALPAGKCRSPLAQSTCRRDHLAVVVTDREIFVQREHDRNRWPQRATRRPDRLDAEAQHVVEMHEVGRQLAQESLERTLRPARARGWRD